jgi:hypothetical protein
MSDIEKKARLSGESPRASEPNTTLPTVNAATEKPEPPEAALHPAFYVMYASLVSNERQRLHLWLQLLDLSLLQRDSVQQVSSGYNGLQYVHRRPVLFTQC